MQTFSLFFLLLLISFKSASAKPVIDPKEFRSNFESFLAHKLSSDFPVTRHRTDKIQYVFVAGFLNEKNFYYFTDNKKQLTWKHIPNQVIYPSSAHAFEENMDPLFDQIKNLDGKLVLIGHSKGAVETLAMAVKNAKWIQDHVEAIILIQGAFGGSAVADYMQGKLLDLKKMSEGDQILFSGLRELEGFVDPLINGGLRSLVTETSRDYWKSIVSKERDAVSRISDKVLYIRSTKKTQNMTGMIQATSRLIRVYGGYGKETENDGLVAFEDQKVDGLGTPLLDWIPTNTTVGADHADLAVARTPGATREPENLRASLMRALMVGIEKISK
jgi:pimeloyl-ACP methyl ester carboxylesterase